MDPTRRSLNLLAAPLAQSLSVAIFGLLFGACAQEGSEQRPSPKRTPKAHLVEIEVAKVQTLGQRSIYSGTLKARRTLRVFTQEEGRITELSRFEGDLVSQGDVLVRLDDALLRAQLDKAIATRHQAELDLKRLSGLSQKRLVSEDELARAKTAAEVARAEESILRTRLGYTTEKAPFKGVIQERLAEPGDVVSKYTHVLTLADPASLVIELGVSELVLPQLRVGDPVEVRVDALGSRSHPGQILRIHPSLDVRSRQGTVEVTLTPVPPKAAAGQFCRVTLRPSGRERLLVPFAALRRDRQGEFVFRLDPHDRVRRAPIRSGEKFADRIEILQGVDQGARVVVRGFLGLRAGMKVKIVERG